MPPTPPACLLQRQKHGTVSYTILHCTPASTDSPLTHMRRYQNTQFTCSHMLEKGKKKKKKLNTAFTNKVIFQRPFKIQGYVLGNLDELVQKWFILHSKSLCPCVREDTYRFCWAEGETYVLPECERFSISFSTLCQTWSKSGPVKNDCSSLFLQLTDRGSLWLCYLSPLKVCRNFSLSSSEVWF